MSSAQPADPLDEKLAKYLARCGVASRRTCENYIRAGWVEVNGELINTPETRIVSTECQVRLRGKLITPPESFRYILLNKPVGILSTCKPGKERGRTILELVVVQERVFPVGRLDRDTSGLLILTNDGQFANRLAHPKYNKEKEYIVEVARAITSSDLKKLQAGIALEDGLSKFIEVQQLSDNKIRLVMTQGRNRQIRRTLRAINLPIKSLHRTRIGPMMLGNLTIGKWRDLTPKEIKILKSGVT